MLSDAQIQAFDEKGYLLGPQVIDENEVETLRQEVLNVLDRRDQNCPQPVLLRNLSPNKDAPVWQIVNIYEVSEPFRRLAHNPIITQAAAQLMKARELRIWHDQIQYKPPSKGGVNMWHQDSPLWPTLLPKWEQVTAWVALDDAGLDNGCMSMVDGSHLWGDQMGYLRTLSKFDDMPNEFQKHAIRKHSCPVKAGCVHFHHSLTWHASHANTSGRHRRAIALHYMTERTCYNAAGDHCVRPIKPLADGQRMVDEKFPKVYPAN